MFCIGFSSLGFHPGFSSLSFHPGFSSLGFHPCVNHTPRYLPTINLSSESLTGLDSEQKQHSTNYTGGEKAGQNWTEKVMGVKQTKDTPSQLPQDQNEGVDEDEWVRSVCVGAGGFLGWF